MKTIRDVAREAKVSVATVSRVLNQQDTVRAETREAVEAAIAKLGYSPNFLGKNLRQLETRRVLVILNSISNQFYSRVVRGIEERAREEGYQVLLCMTRDSRETLEHHLQMLRTRVVDGAIYMSTELSAREIAHYAEIYPLVCACEPLEESGVSVVSIDNEKAGEDAVNFLVDHGCRNIAAISAGGYSYSSVLRERGYRNALLKNGLLVQEELILREGLTFRAGIRAAEKLLSLAQVPDGVFAFADAAAMGLISRLAQEKIRVPEDLSVMGFDNTAVSEVFLPALTTVAQPQYEIGRQAMELLLRRLAGQKEPQIVVPEYTVIVRDSVKEREHRV